MEILKNILRFFILIFYHYIPNNIINRIPFYFVRHFYYKLIGVKIGKDSSIHMRVFFEGISIRQRGKITIGEATSIGRNSMLDARGGLRIGNNISISPDVKIITAQHKLQSSDFEYIEKSTEIKDYVWIGTGAIILPGVTIGIGAVIGAGSVISKNVDDFDVVIGNPQRVVKKRNKNLNYKCKYFKFFE